VALAAELVEAAVEDVGMDDNVIRVMVDSKRQAFAAGS
jgi:hypothetical protein